MGPIVKNCLFGRKWNMVCFPGYRSDIKTLLSMNGIPTMLARAASLAIASLYNATLGSFPDTVQVETTNACNARCIICPHRRMQRPIHHMTEDLFRSIVDECAEHSCRSLHLHNFGEPLLDRDLPRRIAHAKSRNIRQVKIFSNGSLLSGRLARELIDSGLDEIKISFDGASKEEYEKIRYPLRYDIVTQNVADLITHRDRTGSTMRITMACCSTSDKDATMNSLADRVDGFSFGKVHNWGADQEFSAKRQGIRKPCSRVWRTFTVLADGRASLCCLDYEGQVVLGTLHDQSIAAIWRNPAYGRIRRAHARAEQSGLPLCGGCTKSFW